MHLRKLFLCLMLVFVSAGLWGQNAVFTGHVTDPTGAAIARANVVIHNQDTGVDINTITTKTGDYTAPYLAPGEYSISATAKGFATENKINITLEVSKTAVINFSLKVGATSEVVTVNADEAILDFGKADYGEVVENTRVTELPINGGDPGMLSILNAGVIWTGSIEYQRPFDDTQANLSVNGGGAGNVGLMLDGVSNSSASTDNSGSAKISYVPPTETVKEFKIITNPYDASLGLMAGGVEDVILKSGTNKLHGSVYEYARRTWLDANTWSNDWYIKRATAGTDLSSYKTPPMKWDQYGAELDGPITIPWLYKGKDKSFFTLSYQNFKETEPNTITESVPSPSWKTGDFSNLEYWTGSAYAPMSILDPQSAYQDSNGTWRRYAFGPDNPVQTSSTNVIPSGRINAMAQKIIDMYPDPNTTTASGTNPFANNYTTTGPDLDRYRNVLGKWDQKVSDKNRFSISYGYWERIETRSTNGFSNGAEQGQLPHGERSHTFTLQDTHAFTSNLLFDFRANVSVRADYTQAGPTYDPTNLGWSKSQVDAMGTAVTAEFPLIEPSEFAYLGSDNNSEAVSNSLSLLPSVTWIKGKHALHMGLDGRFMQLINHKVSGGNYFWVDRMWTQTSVTGSWDDASGNSIASLLLGNPSSGDDSINVQTAWSNHYWAPFIQDDFKVTHRLTLNLGVRWDMMPAATERHNYGNYAFDTNAINPINSSVSISGVNAIMGGVTFMGIGGNPRGGYKTTWHNIQPRVGLAFALSDKTVLRTGFGESMVNPQNGPNSIGYSSTTTYQAYNPSYAEDVLPNLTNPISNPYSSVVQPVGSSLGLETDLGQGPWFLNPRYQIPSFWNYSAGFEHQFTRDDTVNVSYVGSRLYNGDSSDEINRESLTQYSACNPQTGGRLETCQNNLVTNPFYGISAFSGSTYYTDSTITALNLSRPYPEFSDIIEYQQNDAHSWYNSLQVTGTHRWSKKLTLHGTWTYSKMMDSGGWKDTNYRVPSRSIDSNDYTHRVTLSGVYQLPVGTGALILPNANKALNNIIGGWELGALYVYHTGSPWAVPNNPNEQYIHNAYVKPHIQKDDGYLRLAAACADNYVENSAGVYKLTALSFDYDGTCTNGPDFVAVPSYGETTNTVYTGIRIPRVQQFDANLSKNFKLYNALGLQIRLEAFNALNHPLWSEKPDGSTEDSTFGLIEKGPTGQSNLPRQMQLMVKVTW